MNDWWKEAVIYQIYPRSFLDTSGNGIGDLGGISKKLQYVADLGVDAIWLSPIFSSPMKDMGYDVSDYKSIDPLFGTMEDFDFLISTAHDKNLKVIIDQVLSHSSDQLEAFQESKNNKSSIKSDWYVWADPNADGSPPNNWLSVFGGSAWEWEPKRGQYYFHNFLPSQPDFNFHNEEVQDFLLDVVKFWLEKGVDGFRLDTVNYYFHDKQLRNNPQSPIEFKQPPVNPYYMQNQIFSINQDENLIFLNKFRMLLDSFSEKTSVGEVGDSHRAIEIMKNYTSESRLHMAYSFELLGNKFSSSHIKKTIEEFHDSENNGNWPCWSFSNHDVTRHLSRWDQNESEEFAKLTGALLLSLRGTPCLYQGEELGQVETDLEFEELTDPPGIRFWPLNKGRDGCRTPMTWDHQLNNAGFTEGQPWLPVKNKQRDRSVTVQENNDKSVLNLYKKLIRFRKENEPLVKGNQVFIHDEKNILVFLREYKSSQALCVFNLNDKKHIINTTSEIKPLEDLSFNAELNKNQIELNKFGFMIIITSDLKEQQLRNDIKLY